MSFESWFFSTVVYPSYHALKRDGVMARIAEYEARQWLGSAQLRAVQAEKLSHLIRHSAQHVPYYRERLAGTPVASWTPEKLAGLAPLTKADIRKSIKQLIAENVQPSKLEWHTTSGSTGEPLYFYMDARSSDARKASVIRTKRWMGIEPGERELLLWGSPIDADRAQRLRGRLHGLITGVRLVSTYDLSRPRLQACLDVIERFRPKLLVAYPSVLEELARELAESHRAATSVRAVLASAETLFPHQRDRFEAVFDAPVFNRYGCREVGDIAQECPEHAGLHINSDRVLVEVVRDDSTACEPGEVGNVLVTDLENYSMPLIRYAIGDRAAFAAPGDCACGRGLPRLELVEGRTLDVVRFPNGSAVGGTYWVILLRRRPDRAFHGMEQFQVVQQRPDEVTIRYVADAPVKPEAAQMIRQQVAKRAGPRFGVKFERVDGIALNVAGKRRVVVSELPAALPHTAPAQRQERAMTMEDGR